MAMHAIEHVASRARCAIVAADLHRNLVVSGLNLLAAKSLFPVSIGDGVVCRVIR
jgi:hypothetical protein